MIVTKTIMLDVNKSNTFDYIEVHEGDVNSRRFYIKLTDGSSVCALNNSMSAKVNMANDGVILALDEALTVDVSNNRIVLVLTDNMCSLPGTAVAEITVTENTEVLTAAKLKFYISPAVVNDDSRFEPAGQTWTEQLAGKANLSDKSASIQPGSPSASEQAKYPSVYAVKDFVNDEVGRKQDKPTRENQVALTWTSGQLIHADGTIGSVSGTKYAVSNAITVSAGEVYHINTKMNYANAFFVFLDSNSAVVYVEPTGDTSSTVSEFDGKVTVPPGAVTLRVATYSNNSAFSASTVASVDYLDFSLNDYFDLADSLNAVVEPKFVERDGERVDDWLLNASGLPRSVSNYSIIVADVEGGETLKATGKPWHANYYCAFYDKDIDFDSTLEGGGFTSQDFISGLKGTSTTTDEEFVNIEITVPVNAKKVIVGGTKNFAPHLYVLSGYQIKRKWVGKKWCAVGDSITEKNGKALKNYLDYISEATGIEVDNKGVSGTGYKKQEDINRAFYQRISNVPTDCDVVTIFGSFNDGSMIYGEPLTKRTYTPTFPDTEEGAAEAAKEAARIAWIQGKYISKSGEITSTEATGYAVTNAIPVIPNRIYRIKTRMKYDRAFFAFMDNTVENNGNVIYVKRLNDTSGSGSVREFDGYIKAPEDVKYLYVSTAVYDNTGYETTVREDNIGFATDTGTATLGGCINTTIDNFYAIFAPNEGEESESEIIMPQLGIISPTPWDNYNPYNRSSANIYVDLLEQICKIRSIPFLNLYYESNLRPWDRGFRNQMYSRDGGSGTHPDENGHKLIAPRIEAFLDRLLLH